MAQKDYVGRGRSTGPRRKKTPSRRQPRRQGAGVSKLLIVLAVAIVVAFAGMLGFLANNKNKKEETQITPEHKTTGNGLPPKPEERWKYIKELENRQIAPPSPTTPAPDSSTHSATALTDEQRQLLEQIQADMRQRPTQLNEVPWDEQTPAQRQVTLQRQKKMQQQRESAVTQAPAVTHAPRPAPVSVHPTTPPKPSVSTPKSSTMEETAKSKPQRWMVQCGSFKSSDQAESIRAQLAFEGFESRITTRGEWHRVVTGPYNNRDSATGVLKRLRHAGHSGCIPVTIGG